MKTKSLHLILVLSTLGICSCGKNDDNGLALYSHWTNWTQHNTSLSSPISSHGSYLVVLQREAMRLNIKEFDDGNVRTVHSFEMSYPDNHIFYSTPVEFNGEIFLEFYTINSSAERETEKVKIEGAHRISATTTGTRGRPEDTIIGGYQIYETDRVFTGSEIISGFYTEEVVRKYTSEYPCKFYLFVADFPDDT